MSLNGWMRVLGFTCVAASVTWWYWFFERVSDAIAVRVPDLFQDAWPCLFYTTTPCQVTYNAAEVLGSLSYRPFLTWIGLGLLVFSSFVSAEIEPDYLPPKERQEPRF
jgi:hypothetical protein